ncbi:cysteine-rich CWC family protein [Pseudarcicella hirudinis]|uniref:cysteine-rich CWC family protein n=1 Tax=Pseudarcicella hirudinis TaxID=1079859 RepID=UPI000B85C9C1
MTKHAKDACPRCGEIFVCKVNSILKCDCLKIELTRKQTEYIRDLSVLDFDGSCLCLNCLKELQLQVSGS